MVALRLLLRVMRYPIVSIAPINSNSPPTPMRAEDVKRARVFIHEYIVKVYFPFLFPAYQVLHARSLIDHIDTFSAASTSLIRLWIVICSDPANSSPTASSDSLATSRDPESPPWLMALVMICFSKVASRPGP